MARLYHSFEPDASFLTELAEIEQVRKRGLPPPTERGVGLEVREASVNS